MSAQCFIDDSLDRWFIGSIEGMDLYMDLGVQLVDLALMYAKILVLVITQVDSLGAITGKLVGSCAANAGG